MTWGPESREYIIMRRILQKNICTSFHLFGVSWIYLKVLSPWDSSIMPCPTWISLPPPDLGTEKRSCCYACQSLLCPMLPPVPVQQLTTSTSHRVRGISKMHTLKNVVAVGVERPSPPTGIMTVIPPVNIRQRKIQQNLLKWSVCLGQNTIVVKLVLQESGTWILPYPVSPNIEQSGRAYYKDFLLKISVVTSATIVAASAFAIHKKMINGQWDVS